MNMTLFEKFKLLFEYSFSSILSISIFILFILLLFVLLFNMRKKSKFINFILVAIYLGIFIGIVISNFNYVVDCINGFVKCIMNYIYFPSTLAYFFIIFIVTVILIFTIFSKKISSPKKIVNYVFFTILYFLFTSFVVLAASQGIDLVDKVNLYKNNTILAIVQVSNLLLVFWLIFTGFYNLFLFYRRKYD